MTDTLELHATLEPRGPAGAFLLSDEQVAAIGGGKKAFPVTVAVNGHTLSLRLARMGGENMIGLAKAARAEAGVELGGTYDIVVAADGGERTIEVPDDLAAALAASPPAGDMFAKLAPSHRKEYVRWVTEAKKAETRASRIAKAVEMVLAGRTR
ncbi:MAG: YdeI/OmpD-associated family protein [Acidimicrobiales bacterium]